jgi:hypothetical protein
MHNYLFLYIAHHRNEDLRQATERPGRLMADELKRKRPTRRLRRGSR